MKYTILHKLFLTIILLPVPCLLLNAQIIHNGNFETWTFTGGTCDDNPVNNTTSNTSPFATCTPTMDSYWAASHGSPEIFNNGSAKSAVLWSGDFSGDNDGLNFVGGEGIVTYCSFHTGKAYQITFKIRSALLTIDNVYIDIANSVPAITYADFTSGPPAYTIPSIPDKQTIVNIQNFNSVGFQTQTVEFIANSNYDYLWIHPYTAANSSTHSLLIIDEVQISDCLDNITYSNTSTLPGITFRSNFIATSGSVQVLSGQNVTFIAGNYISLQPGFSANQGSTFHAYISSCDQLVCTNPVFRTVDPGTVLNSAFPFVKLYPNPARNQMHIETFNLAQVLTIQIYNLQGWVVKEFQSADATINIDVADLPSGLFFVKLSSGLFQDTRKVQILR